MRGGIYATYKGNFSKEIQKIETIKALFKNDQKVVVL